MSGSILIYGGNKKTRDEILLERLNKIFSSNHSTLREFENNPDIYVIDHEENKKSIGIQQVKEGTSWLMQKPFSSKTKVLAVRNADLLTTQAQNALLKSLEEPPSYASIYLLSKSERSLLETVISRCKKNDVRKLTIQPDQYTDDELQNIFYIIDLDEGDKLVIADKLSKLETEELIEMLEKWLTTLRNDINSKPNDNRHDLYSIASNILSFKEDLETTNISQKFGLENLLINLDD